MSGAPPDIDISGLSLVRGGRALLDGVDLKIRRGERVAIVGPNGAGKTTLLRCALGMVSGQRGEVKIGGRPVGELSRRAIAGKVAYLPQAAGGDIPFTVRDFVLMSRYAHAGTGGGEEAAQEAMRRVGVSHLANRTVATLSGGERQKVCLAGALTQQVPVLLLDEPAAHLDPKQRDSIEEVLAGLENRTLVTVTHDLNWAAMDFDRIIGMRCGKIVRDGAPGDLMTPENLKEVFETDWELYPHPESGVPVVIRAATSYRGRRGGRA